MSALRKPVIVRKLTREWYTGYAAPNVPENGPEDGLELELLDAAGKLLRIPWNSLKWVCYVRELDVDGWSSAMSRSDPQAPERLLRRRFASRPRINGVWLRLTLGDGDELEGVAANDLSLLQGSGLMLTPPDTRSHTQRVLVPRSAIRELNVLGVIAPGAPARTPKMPQPGLFEPRSFAPEPRNPPLQFVRKTDS